MKELVCSFEGTVVHSGNRREKGKISSGEEFFLYKGELMVLDSSMVEPTAVNRVVVGSSPTRGAG